MLDNLFPPLLEAHSITALAVDRHFRTAYANQWSLGVQQQLARNTLVELTYFGSKGVKGVASLAANTSAPTATPSQAQRAYPSFSTITYAQDRAYSNFNSLQAKLQQSNTNGVSYLLSYTFSTSLDNAPGPEVVVTLLAVHRRTIAILRLSTVSQTSTPAIALCSALWCSCHLGRTKDICRRS